MAKTKKAAKPTTPAVATPTAAHTSKVIKSHTFKFMGDVYDGEALALSAERIQSATFDIKQEREVFATKFLLLAKSCKTQGEFQTLMTAIEANQSWKSKGNPAGENKAPAVFTQYKSNVNVHWDKFKTAPHGFESMKEYSEKLQEKRKEASATDNKDKAAQGLSTTVEQATKANQELGNVLTALTTVFPDLPQKTQGELIEALKELHTDVSDVLEEQKLEASLKDTGKEAAKAA